MIHSHSDIPSQESHLCNIYQSDERVIQSNDFELYQLVKKTTEMKNTGEEKVNHEIGDVSVKTGLVKSLLIGVAILTGVGALAAGGYCYMAGRASSARTDNRLPAHHLAPEIANIIPLRTDSRSSMISGGTLLAITSSPLITETASSPYAYYEGIYGDPAERNKSQSLFPVTTTAQPVTTTKAPVMVALINDPITTTASSTDRAETAVTEYKHESGRSIYYQSVKSKYNYPLGTKFFNELLAFCHAEIQAIIQQAYRGNQKLRCKLLDEMNDKIQFLKEDEALIRRINADKETLSVKEHGEEIMLRRKLATLYLAAEFIINKKDFDVFLREVNRDYKRYSTKALEQREDKIINYFPEAC